jgi:hypothetical protein
MSVEILEFDESIDDESIDVERRCWFHIGDKHFIYTYPEYQPSGFDFLLEIPSVSLQTSSGYFTYGVSEIITEWGFNEEEAAKFRAFRVWYDNECLNHRMIYKQNVIVPEEHQEMYDKFCDFVDQEYNFTLTVEKEALLLWIEETFPMMTIPRFNANDLSLTTDETHIPITFRVAVREGMEEPSQEMKAKFCLSCVMYQVLLSNHNENVINGTYSGNYVD